MLQPKYLPRPIINLYRCCTLRSERFYYPKNGHKNNKKNINRRTNTVHFYAQNLKFDKRVCYVSHTKIL